jgi:hypothetical protein
LTILFSDQYVYVSVWLNKAPKKEKKSLNVCCPSYPLFYCAIKNSLDCKKRAKKQEQKT